MTRSFRCNEGHKSADRADGVALAFAGLAMLDPTAGFAR
jgi:hypothetical protein